MISLGIDIGGTGCKCVAFSDSGKQLAVSYREYPLSAGQVNLPAEMLASSVEEVIADCVSRIPDPGQVAAVTVSSFGESFVPVDRDGNALTDILLYFANTESREFDELVQKVGEEKFMRVARILPDASYSLSKILYTEKAAARPVWKYLFIAGYIAYRLSGRAVTDVSLACRSLLYDVEKRAWSQELIEAAGIREDQLPEVLPTGSVAGTLLPRVAEKTGLSPSTKVVIGAHDQIVNALGAGVTKVGDAVDISGTCECLQPLYAAIPGDLGFQKENFACVPFLENRGYVTYAYNNSAGSVVRWYRDALAGFQAAEAKEKGVSVYDLFNAQCPERPTALMVLPFLQGMGGTPDVDASATGLIAGLTMTTRLPDIYRAILEGITYEIRYNKERLSAFGLTFDRLLACGGGARSRAWLQIKADILGVEIVQVKTEETGAMGSAILGFAAVTGKSPFEIAKAFYDQGESFFPIPENREIYEQRYQMYKTLRGYYRQMRAQETGGKA